MTDRGFERRQTWLVGAGMLLILAFTGITFERLNAQAHQSQVTAYNSCMARNINAHNLNTLYQTIVSIERNNRFIDKAVRDQRVAAYSKAQLVLPDCGTKP